MVIFQIVEHEDDQGQLTQLSPIVSWPCSSSKFPPHCVPIVHQYKPLIKQVKIQLRNATERKYDGNSALMVQISNIFKGPTRNSPYWVWTQPRPILFWLGRANPKSNSTCNSRFIFHFILPLVGLSMGKQRDAWAWKTQNLFSTAFHIQNIGPVVQSNCPDSF